MLFCKRAPFSSSVPMHFPSVCARRLDFVFCIIPYAFIYILFGFLKRKILRKTEHVAENGMLDLEINFESVAVSEA